MQHVRPLDEQSQREMLDNVTTIDQTDTIVLRRGMHLPIQSGPPVVLALNPRVQQDKAEDHQCCSMVLKVSVNAT